MDFVNNTLTMGSAAHAAKRAADIIFVLENKDSLDDKTLIGRVNETLIQYGEKNANVTRADLRKLKAVSRKLHAVFATENVEETARLLNKILDKYTQAPRLSDHGKTPWHLHVDSSDHAPWAEWFAASSALALAVMLADKQRNPGGLCALVSCQRPFIDFGKGSGRNYCSPRCATRERVAAYRKRKNVTN